MTLRHVAVDTEGTGLYPWSGARAFAWGFYDVDGWTDYVEFPVDPFTREVLYHKNPRGRERVAAILSDPKIVKVYFNAKYDIRMSEFAGFKHEGPIEEVSFAIKIAGVERPWWKLKPFAKRTFGIEDADEKDLHTAVDKLRGRAARIGWKLGPAVAADYWMIARAEEILIGGLKTLEGYKKSSPVKQAKMRLRDRQTARSYVGLCERYNVRDAERTILGWLWAEDLMERLEVESVYAAEMDLWPVTYELEARGLYVDMDSVRRGKKFARRETEEAMAELRRLVGRDDYNPGSSPQRIAYFIDELKLPALTVTKAGNPSIDATFHEFYEATVPACRETVRYAKSQKAETSYYDYLALAEFDNNIIHPDLNQFGTKTGRFSGRFQTIPKRLPDGDVMLGVRKSITPRPGHVLYCGDYKQIEARVYADEFEEKTLLKAFADDADPYEYLRDAIVRGTGAAIGRQIAKSIFLGKIYGLGVNTMCGQIRDQMAAQGLAAEIRLEDAKEVLEAFDETFPDVTRAMKETQRQAKQDGYVMNRYGQKIQVDREFAYRGVNYIVQPTAARLMKRAMVNCHRYLKEVGFGWIVLTIHDELIFEFEKARRPVSVLRGLKDVMEDNEGMFELVDTPVDFDKCVTTWLTRSPCKWAM